jgi:hypothetical protein
MKFEQKILLALEQHGLLLEADSELPSIATIIAGEPIKGSWWGHKMGTVIFNTCENLCDRSDILRIKLLKGKVTYIHQRLWSAVATIGTAKDAWQTADLSTTTKKLLSATEKAGCLRADEKPSGLNFAEARLAIKDLEERLLAVSTSVHTESGAHVKAVESWESWFKQRDFKPTKIVKAKAFQILEQAALELGIKPKKRSLPWPWIAADS